MTSCSTDGGRDRRVRRLGSRPESRLRTLSGKPAGPPVPSSPECAAPRCPIGRADRVARAGFRPFPPVRGFGTTCSPAVMVATRPGRDRARAAASALKAQNAEAAIRVDHAVDGELRPADAPDGSWTTSSRTRRWEQRGRAFFSWRASALFGRAVQLAGSVEADTERRVRAGFAVPGLYIPR